MLDYIGIAQTMVTPCDPDTRLDPRLQEMLHDAATRCYNAPGYHELRSVQVISGIIAVWEATGGALDA